MRSITTALTTKDGPYAAPREAPSRSAKGAPPVERPPPAFEVVDTHFRNVRGIFQPLRYAITWGVAGSSFATVPV